MGKYTQVSWENIHRYHGKNHHNSPKSFAINTKVGTKLKLESKN